MMDTDSRSILPTAFVRDRIVWLSYLMIATYCYIASALGPAMVFLRDELQISYTVAAYHFSIWSFGVVCAGLTGDRIVGALGKSRAVWFACFGICLGSFCIAASRTPYLSIPAALATGFSGSVMAQTLAAFLAERFAEERTLAISEANIAASLSCSLAPLAVSFASKTSLGWRLAFLLPLLAFLFYFFLGRKSFPKESSEKATGTRISAGSLPGTYWICWILIFFSVASEWSIIYWSADFLRKVGGLANSDAAAAVTSFLLAMVLGRILGSRFARFVETQRLLKFAAFTALIGFILFWLSRQAMVCIFALFLTGLGISNFYPLTFSMALGVSSHLTGKATARMSLSSGLSTLIAPLILGLLAEKLGIHSAFGFIAFMLVLCNILVLMPIWTGLSTGMNAESKTNSLADVDRQSDL